MESYSLLHDLKESITENPVNIENGSLSFLGRWGAGWLVDERGRGQETRRPEIPFFVKKKKSCSFLAVVLTAW